MSPTDTDDTSGKLSAVEIAAARAALGLNRAALADRLGVSTRTVEKWEGEGSERAPQYLRLALQLLAIRIADERKDRSFVPARTMSLVQRVAEMA